MSTVLVACRVMGISLLAVAGSISLVACDSNGGGSGGGPEITKIIGRSGDGAGNFLLGPTSVIVKPKGKVYVVGSFSNNVFEITSGGSITEIIDETGDGAGQELKIGFLNSVATAGVAVAPNNNVYVVGGVSNNAFSITPGGTITQIIDATGDGAGNSLTRPDGVAVAPNGNVYVVGSTSDNVFEITPGGVITQIIDATGDGAGNALDLPTGIAVDLNGNVFVAGVRSDNVFEITPGGVITQIIDATGDGTGNPLVGPTGLAVDPAGNLYVAGGESNNAFSITPGGTITQIIDADGDKTGDGTCVATDARSKNPFCQARGIDVGPDGNVYVTGSSSDNVFRIRPSGTIKEILDETGDDEDPTVRVYTGIAVDGRGDVYVVTTAKNNVLRLEF
ncbi:MAG: NHL repeat-containing protein [Deltaproteobacteria bacterium]|nr:NHL repeat-containing protein [Deltaproteobacteria bacterium]MBW2390786.1 NHL repeat-containing protein [Deltaproteobacteria bacterium]MBW2725024.1 NHL repeat-containing protein [Deltaproteobacteria bacterium]